jgi:hypothetical protein
VCVCVCACVCVCVCVCVQVEVDFKAECMAGDTIECHASLTEIPEVMGAPGGAKAVLHVVRKCTGHDCKELVRMRSVWKPKSA